MPLYIGLMSGTSADAIDAALVDIQESSCRVITARQFPLSDELRMRIIGLYQPGENEVDRLGSLDQAIGRAFGDAVVRLLDDSDLSAQEITAVGSHGQTIRHRPRIQSGENFTLQIGDPNLIAQRTGIITVADFRRRDMAAGGQGAPLVPAFHRAVFATPEKNRIILNIGGIANITLLKSDGSTSGYDTGPGNGLMDAWISRCRGARFDVQGGWAASGQINSPLLKALCAHPYFRLPPPKSTGKEEFHLHWLDSVLQEHPPISSEDVQATLLELTAVSIAEQICSECKGADVVVCGGGAHNTALLQRLGELLEYSEIYTTDKLGIPSDFVEAAAFAWLAMRTLKGLTGNLCSVTGAKEEVVLGGIYPGRNWNGCR